MVAVAGPGSFSDADMLPIGSTFSMNGAGKKVPVTSFTLDQAYSALCGGSDTTLFPDCEVYTTNPPPPPPREGFFGLYTPSDVRRALLGARGFGPC